MNNFQLTYSHYSETSILVQWPQYIAPEILKDIVMFKSCLLELDSEPIIQIINTYSSILIIYDSYITDFKHEETALKSKYKSRENLDIQYQRLWKIPVCYDPVFALDLDEIAKEKDMLASEIIQVHSEAIYKVYFIGFLPGFLYLGGLDKRLFSPRKTSPRQHVDKGAVGIGGEQTGIYPNASPGGWKIIGNSPLDFFNPKLETPCFASAGDHIQFVAVDFKTHQDILSDIKNGTYSIESEGLDD